jgi:hypothetical protein
VWEEASRRRERVGELLDWYEKHEFRDLLTERMNDLGAPNAREDAWLDEVIEANGEALRLLDEGAARERCELPTEGTKRQRTGGAVHTLEKLRLLRAMRMAQKGNTRRAIDQLGKALRDAQILGACGPGILELVEVLRIDQQSMAFGRWLARWDLDEHTRAALAVAFTGDMLSGPQVLDAAARSVQSSLDELAEVERKKDLKGLARRLVQWGSFRAAPARRQAGKGWPSRRDSAMAEARVQELLERHPRLFAVEDARRLIEEGMAAVQERILGGGATWAPEASDLAHQPLRRVEQQLGAGKTVFEDALSLTSGVPADVARAFLAVDGAWTRYEAARTLTTYGSLAVFLYERAHTLEDERAELVAELEGTP